MPPGCHSLPGAFESRHQLKEAPFWEPVQSHGIVSFSVPPARRDSSRGRADSFSAEMRKTHAPLVADAGKHATGMFSNTRPFDSRVQYLLKQKGLPVGALSVSAGDGNRTRAVSLGS